MIIAALFALFSCDKNEIPDDGSDLTFSRTCDFGGSDVEVVEKLSASLQYINTLPGVTVMDYKFVLMSPPYLPMIICNMPAEFEMEEDESRSVTFSGRVLVYPENIDALSTDVELRFLKFEEY